MFSHTFLTHHIIIFYFLLWSSSMQCDHEMSTQNWTYKHSSSENDWMVLFSRWVLIGMLKTTPLFKTFFLITRPTHVLVIETLARDHPLSFYSVIHYYPSCQLVYRGSNKAPPPLSATGQPLGGAPAVVHVLHFRFHSSSPGCFQSTTLHFPSGVQWIPPSLKTTLTFCWFWEWSFG